MDVSANDATFTSSFIKLMMAMQVLQAERVTRKNGGRGPDSDQMTQRNFIWPGTRQATSSTKAAAAIV